MMRVMISRLATIMSFIPAVIRIVFRDRVIETRFVLAIDRRPVFPDPGQYVVELLADGEWVAQTVMNLSV